MATIQSRSRFEAKVTMKRSVLGKRTFQNESDARKWLREQVKRGGPRISDRLIRWDPDPGEGVWNATEETELPS